MTKFFRYLFLIFFSLVWLVGCSGDFANFLFKNGIIADDYRYGDLYRLANLPKFRVPVQHCETDNLHQLPPLKNKNLFVIGDSFTEEGRLKASDFVTAGYQRMAIGDSGVIQLDKSRQNILIIETVERHFRERFAKPYGYLRVVNNEVPAGQIVVRKDEKFDWLTYEFPYSTERHESALFAYSFFLRLKEWKALINLHLFGKTDDKVALSKNGEVLLFGLDVKPSIHSDFDSISEKEIENLAKNVELTQENYRKMGFNEIILSIIPNKTSLYAQDLGSYNHLIERVQQKLPTPFIDIYTPFRNNPAMLYDIGDTHWNCEGKRIWVDKINGIIETIGNRQ